MWCITKNKFNVNSRVSFSFLPSFVDCAGIAGAAVAALVWFGSLYMRLPQDPSPWCALCCLIVSYDYSFASLFDIVFLLILFPTSSSSFSYSFDSFIHYVCFPLCFSLFLVCAVCSFVSFYILFFVVAAVAVVIVDVCNFFLSCFRLFVSLFRCVCLFHNIFFSYYLLSSINMLCAVVSIYICFFLLRLLSIAVPWN